MSSQEIVTGLEGRIFTDIFLAGWVAEDDPDRDQCSRLVYETYMAALKEAFPDAELDFEEIDSISFFDTFTARIGEGEWTASWDLEKDVHDGISGILYGIECGLMATKYDWLDRMRP
jgi:hypothetical protein